MLPAGFELRWTVHRPADSSQADASWRFTNAAAVILHSSSQQEFSSLAPSFRIISSLIHLNGHSTTEDQQLIQSGNTTSVGSTGRYSHFFFWAFGAGATIPFFPCYRLTYHSRHSPLTTHHSPLKPLIRPLIPQPSNISTSLDRPSNPVTNRYRIRTASVGCEDPVLG